MKRLSNYAFLLCFTILMVSCTTHDKFDGTPEDNNLSIETITGTIVSSSNFVLPGQSVDFTAILPQEFVTMVNDTINVEAITSTLGGVLRKSSVQFLPGQQSVTSKVTVGGGNGSFFMPVEIKLNAIALKHAFPGKHFLLNSNVLSLASGDSTVPADNDSEFQVKIAWENLTVGNNIECKISRVNSTAVTLKGTVANSTFNIIYNGVSYPVTYNTDLSTTATNFFNANQAAFLSNNIVLTAVGKSLIFSSTTSSPVITVSSSTGSNLGGAVFNSLNFPASGSVINPRSYSVKNFQKTGTTSNEVEGSTYLYNPGDYKVTINAISLEETPKNLKYRIIIKQPSGVVTIYNEVYNGMTLTSGPKDVLSFTKTGIGDSSVYSNITKL
jgi:hypothetical protein